MKLKLSDYQKEILDWVEDGSGNGLVNALAGTGKTTTLELISQKIPTKMLFLAFNKHIADELSSKPGLQPLIAEKKLKIMTVNSLGNMTVMDYVKNHMDTVPELKSNKLTSLILEPIIYDRVRKENKHFSNDSLEAKVVLESIKKHAKTCCDLVRCHCIDYKNLEAIDWLIEQEHLFNFSRDFILKNSIPMLEWSYIVSEAIEDSTNHFLDTGQYDFIEQIYLPVHLGMFPPAWIKWYTDFIGCDEAQDLSTLQQRFIKKLQYMNPYKDTRYIFVGDERQAIYKFNGADCNSINHIREQFHTHELHLNICYRCPHKALEIARKYVPQIEDSPTAKEGKVYVIDNLDVANLVQPKDLVMARKNKDLVSVYLQIVKLKKKVFFKKADFLYSIVNEVEKRKKIKTLDDVRKFINKEKNKSLNSKEEKSINIIDIETEDIFDIMDTLLDFFESNYKDVEFPCSVQGFVDFLRSIATDSPTDDSVVVGSIHAMKGLESKNVFIINYFDMPYDFGMGTEYNIQEKNLKYIAETRTKENLYLCYDCIEDSNKFTEEFEPIINSL